MGGQNLNYVFVKTGPISYGTISAASLPTVRYDFDNSLVIYIATAAGSISFSAASCQTPDVLVDLGVHRTSEFTGVGAYSASKGFNIALNNCPPGINNIRYQIDALTNVLGGNGSVVALDGASTVTGVGVQLLDGSDKPFALGSTVSLAGFNGSTGGNYTIPLRARYYQTGSKVTSGTANTLMTFTMVYQ